uniref:uncharacterized protein LOC120334744 isoform X1 n=1 Tax=Styela clava TaxID=7725 RepID=UPI00193A6DBC|nr:uncharacterized protein LOC120334744 isoform X1 [Styela clava]
MDESSGPPGDFAQRYLTRQSFSPGQGIYMSHRSSSDQNSHFRNSMPGSCNEFSPFKPSNIRSPECRKIMDRISTFCGKENLVQRVAFLDQELSVFGYPSIVSDFEDDLELSPDQQQSGAIDLVTLVNISYDLLRSWRQSFEIQSESNDVQRSSEAEIVRLRHLASRLKEDIANKDRDLKSKELMQLQLSQRMESLKKKFKLEQDKSKKLSAEMTARDSQFRHEKKKKVQEIEKLQSRLQQLLQDKRHERMLGIEILNSLQRSDGKRGKWSTDKTKKSNEQDMYRLIITNYEDSQKQLLKENDGMRKYLKEMQNELISALNERTNNVHDQSQSSNHGGVKGQTEGDRPDSSRSSSAASNMSETSDVSEPMSDGMFEMPYDLVKEDIEKSIRNKWRALKKEIRKTRNADKAPQSNKENYTENEYDDLVQQQQELIDYLTTGEGESSDRPIPEDCYFLEEKADFEKEKNVFNQQKQAFDKERQLYAEALLQLDEQRQSFEIEKNKWLQQNFLQLTPFRDNRPSTAPHPNLRGKETSSHYIKSTRQQPYQARPSISPDRSLKGNDQQQSKSYQSQQLMQNSPNNITQTLSRLHSSSHHNSFSPDNMQHRSPDPSWPTRTPENNQKTATTNPHRTKSTPNTTNSIPPPSTAELYRSLGLVYYGSDKENEETGNTGNMDSNICPRSSGAMEFHHSMSRGANQQRNISSRSNPGSFKVKIQSKVKPVAQNEIPPSPEYVSAEGSFDSQSNDQKSTESDYFDAERSLRNGSPRRSQRNAPKERSNHSVSKKGIENVPFFTNEFQISQKLPEPGSHFIYSSPQKRRLYSSKSMDEKTFRYDLENDKYEAETAKQKKFGFRSFVRNIISGSPKRKDRDANNNDKANPQLLSNSDSALSLRYYLDHDVESGGQSSIFPSARVTSNTECRPKIDSASSPALSNDVTHQRTRSFPGNEILNTDYIKPRSSSYDSPVLTRAAERHKSALLSLSANCNPTGPTSSQKEPTPSHLKPKPSRYDLKRSFEGLTITNTAKENTSSATTKGSLNQYQGYNFDGKQYQPEMYDSWSNSRQGIFKPTVKVTSQPLIQAEGNQRPKSSQPIQNQPQGDLGMQRPVSASWNQSQRLHADTNKSKPVSARQKYSELAQTSSSKFQANPFNQAGSSQPQTGANRPELVSTNQFQMDPSNQIWSNPTQFGSSRPEPVSTAHCSPSLLEKLTMADQSYGSIAEDDSSASETC